MNKESEDKVKMNVCQIKDCGRPTHKNSKYCIFHAKLAEKEEEEFKKALKEYIAKIKENNLDYNFSEFIFIGKIGFEKEFKVNTFKNAYFSDAIFENEVNFQNATFESSADFERITFKSVVNFVNTTFKSYAFFDGTIFKKYVNFGAATFEGIAGFVDAIFDDDADFEDAIFKDDTSFKEAIFKKDVNFSWAKLPPGKFLSLIVKGRGNIFFEQTFLEHIILSLDLEKDTFIDFTNATLRNTRIKMEEIDGHILQEQEKTFSEAKEIYLLLKNNFHSIGKYKDESWAFKKEKDMERLSYSFNSFIRNTESEEKNNEGKESNEKKSKFILFFNWLRTKNFRKWLSSCFFNIIYGYGERPQNVIFSAMFIIIFFAIFFSIVGINSLEIIEMEGPTVQEIFNSDSEIVFKGNLLSKTTNYFLDCLYFSVITFTTLGFGDFRPLEGWGRIFAGTEAFIGAFMMALFVYTFARRTGGR